MSRENVANNYTPIPTFDTQEPNGKDAGAAGGDAARCRPTGRRFKRTNFTLRDCVIVTVVLLLALAAIVVSLLVGLPALERNRALLTDLNATVAEADDGGGVLHSLTELKDTVAESVEGASAAGAATAAIDEAGAAAASSAVEAATEAAIGDLADVASFEATTAPADS